MALYHIIILALIQGITEFLPISSSGHLVLFHALTGDEGIQGAWNENILYDVAVHVGTLFAVLLYFWRDVWTMILGGVDMVKLQFSTARAQLFLCVVIGSIPVVFAGFALYLWQPDFLRSLQVMAWATLIFGIVLWVVDEKAPDNKDLGQLTWKNALVIGLAQILALIPGTSRSGITMIAGRALGFSRVEAARFSLFLAMVAISGAGILAGKDVFNSADMVLAHDVLLAAFLAFLSALGAIALMMRWLVTSTFKPFAIYRIILGIGLLAAIYSGFLV